MLLPLQDEMQDHGIVFIHNRKFPRDTTDMSQVGGKEGGRRREEEGGGRREEEGGRMKKVNMARIGKSKENHYCLLFRVQGVRLRTGVKY